TTCSGPSRRSRAPLPPAPARPPDRRAGEAVDAQQLRDASDRGGIPRLLVVPVPGGALGAGRLHLRRAPAARQRAPVEVPVGHGEACVADDALEPALTGRRPPEVGGGLRRRLG